MTFRESLETWRWFHLFLRKPRSWSFLRNYTLQSSFYVYVKQVWSWEMLLFKIDELCIANKQEYKNRFYKEVRLLLRGNIWYAWLRRLLKCMLMINTWTIFVLFSISSSKWSCRSKWVQEVLSVSYCFSIE